MSWSLFSNCSHCYSNFTLKAPRLLERIHSVCSEVLYKMSYIYNCFSKTIKISIVHIMHFHRFLNIKHLINVMNKIINSLLTLTDIICWFYDKKIVTDLPTFYLILLSSNLQILVFSLWKSTFQSNINPCNFIILV